MKDNPTISVIVPIYQVEEYIDKCLESIIKQTYRKLEIILIDDGSKDNSGRICDYYAMKDHRINVIHKQNEGVSKARNLGIEKSSGQYICFVDADDYINENYIEELYNLCIENDAEISICGVINIKEDIIKEKSKKIVKVWNSSQAIKELFEEKYFYCVMWAKMYKKEMFDEYRFNEKTKIAEDLEIMYKILSSTKRVAINTTKQLYYYRIRENSALHTKYNNNHENELKIIEEAMFFLNTRYKNIISSIMKKYINVNYRCLKKSIIDRKYDMELYGRIRDNIIKYKNEAKKVKCLKTKIKKFIILYGDWILKIIYKK